MTKKVQILLKNDIFDQKSYCNIFDNNLDMDLMFFGGRNTSLGLTLNRFSDA